MDVWEALTSLQRLYKQKDIGLFHKLDTPIGNKYVRMATMSCGYKFCQSMQGRIRKGTGAVAKLEKIAISIMRQRTELGARSSKFQFDLHTFLAL